MDASPYSQQRVLSVSAVAQTTFTALLTIRIRRPSAYAPQLAARLHLSSVQTNIVGAAGNLGVYLSGPIIGRVVDHDGPRRMLLLATVLLFSGYFALRTLYLAGESRSHVVTLVAFAELLTGIGSTAGLSATGNTIAKSFKKTRATALSLVLSAFGLSAFFYSTIRRALLAKSSEPTAALLLTLAVGTALSMLVGVFFVRPVAQDDDRSPVPEGPSVSPSTPPNERDPLLVVTAESSGESAERTSSTPQRPVTIKRAQSSGVVPISVSGSALVREIDFWLLFAYNACSSGIGLCFINNVGLVTKTLAPSQMSEGLAHGSLFGTSGILVLERFGMERFSSNNGVLALAPAIAGQLTNYMFGRIYDSHVPAHSSVATSDRLCTAGRDCYVRAFHITTAMALGAIALACILVSRKSMKRRAA
ncbi:hypothetical protein OIV83_002844 [Microbotryomycetes sp. JL201]|nr:hypothetical protein OIV83_002844 [Microbotryomycetes sp. JL201]